MTDGTAGRRRTLFCLALVAAVILSGQNAAAAWWFDGARFHVSAHGRMACGDCHSTPETPHPDPRRVSKSIGDLFDPETCYACHAAVRDDLAQHRHGGAALDDPQSHSDCLRCHDPHASPSAGARQSGFDPDRPPQDQCGACHAPQKKLPPPAAEDGACLSCHRKPQAGDPSEAVRVERLCVTCHGNSGSPQQALTGQRLPLIDSEAHRLTAHGALACTDCHTRAAAYDHGRQPTAACTQCHRRHDEKVAHDAHLSVSCEACHLKGGIPIKAPGSHAIEWRASRDLSAPLQTHAMADFADQSQCRRCHFAGNSLGAAAMVLPAKSVICLPCHAATLSVQDPTTWISLAIFIAGLGLGGFLVFGGRRGPRVPRGPAESAGRAFPSGWAAAFKSIFLDVLLQRRLYRRSPKRWMVHGLIFYPMALRTVWGVLAMAASLLAPGWPQTWALLDKNHPAVELVFEVTGLMLLSGIALSALRGRREARSGVAGMPLKDTPALVAIALIVVIGFLLEGLRMAMTGAGSPAAFVGYGLAALFSGATWLTQAYGWVWYAHAIGVGALVAYLPFSRLMHIILSPVVLAMNAFDRRH